MSDAVSVAPSVSPSIAPSLSPSVGTKATHFSSASRSTIRTSSTTGSRRKKKNQHEWRAMTRDAFASVFDLVGDWAYFYVIYYHDFDADVEQMEEEREEDGEQQQRVEDMLGSLTVDAKVVTHATFAFCVLGALCFLWMMLTALKRKFGGNSLGCNCTIPRIALASLIFQDIPQVILTLYIDFRFFGQLTPIGVFNICSSLNAMINRATMHYEEIAQHDEKNVVIITNYEAMP